MSEKVTYLLSLSVYGCLVFLTGEVRLPCGNNLLAILHFLPSWILEAPKMLYSKQDQRSGTKRSPRKWKGIRSSIYGTSLHQKTLRKPFPRLTLSCRRPIKKPKTSPPISCVCQAMDSQTTETKTPLPSRSKVSEICKSFENLNPNLSSPSPAGLKKIANSQGEMEPSGPLSAGRVAHLVEAFERLLKDEYGSNNNQSRCVKNQAFGGRAAEKQVSSSWDNSNSLPACFSEKSDISTLVPR